MNGQPTIKKTNNIYLYISTTETVVILLHGGLKTSAFYSHNPPKVMVRLILLTS